MAPRRRADRPPEPLVDIVLTEEDLAAIIRETVGSRPPASGAAGAPGFAPPSPTPADRAFGLGVRSPGAVGDAIRRILEATTLDRGRRMRLPGGGE